MPARDETVRDAGSTADVSVLRQRAAILDALRAFFRNRGYWEVETPLLSHDVCVDRWLDPIEVAVGAERMFLQTSPEFAMKRLLVAGADAIFQITRAFRGWERGPRHNPEFAMLEWYRMGDSYHQQMDFVEALVRDVQNDTVSPVRPELPAGRFQRVTYDEAFEACFETPVLLLEPDELRELARRHGIAAPESLPADDRDGWLNLLLAERVEPWLAEQGAIFLYDYPASQSALAKVRASPPPVAERFELYLGGFELCNGYQELTNSDELASRMRHQAELRVQSGLSRLPTDSRLIAAMRQGLPECSGVALGLDRLIMWRLGLTSIEDVIPFPIERA